MELALALCAVYLGAAFIIDIRSMKIPNLLTMPAMLLGLIYHGATSGWEGMLFSVKGLVGGFVVLLIMYFIGAVGAGDVKLFGGIGAWCGLWFTLQAVVYSVLFAGLIGLLIVLWRREALKRLRKIAGSVAGVFIFRNLTLWNNGKDEHLRFPFMTAVLPGTIYTYMNIYL
ncbi:A24 family peptidase [Paenibacillus dakarensis]|uniref:A24 family peptidase n=1 Tax=Paenibacillus dakarensis TaxID=1527293 RepID=UPI0006D52FA3|nr:A24 family peptidase [Paenibacillus dakarensis]